MEPYKDFTAHLAGTRKAATRAAFFDLDGTLIDSHSVKDVFKERFSNKEVSTEELLDLLRMSALYALKIGNFGDAMASSLQNLRGAEVAKFTALGEKVTTERLVPVIFPELKAILKAHQAKGDTRVIISSATRFQVEPIARYLGIEHIICTELAEEDGLYTGLMNGPPCYGAEKLRLAKAFCERHGLALKRSYFYSNGAEDLPLLEVVGHPVAINPDKSLARTANKRGWLSLQPGVRGSTGIKDVARTLTTFASVLPAVALGLPIRLLGNERSGINLSISTWASFASWIAGLRMIVKGEQHLWSHRPAVFLFNHQSAMDILITARLMQQDVTGIAKKEIKRQPIMGPAMMAMGAVFIDREHKGNPQEALAPAIAALKKGKSVLVAPEGTRSKDERLGAFKKGAFHLAMQAGVPIVPIVIHNALDALPNHSMVVRPAEVEVTVLKPIPTKDWNIRDLVRCAQDVRRDYLRVLGQSEPGSD